MTCQNLEGIIKAATGPECIYNPITAMGFLAMFTFQLAMPRGKHCWHPIAVMGVVDHSGAVGAFGNLERIVLCKLLELY